MWTVLSCEIIILCKCWMCMYRCWLHTHCVYIRNDAIMYMKKRDAAVKKQSNEHRSRTAHFQLVVVISGREMSAMFGRVTFSYRFVLTFYRMLVVIIHVFICFSLIISRYPTVIFLRTRKNQQCPHKRFSHTKPSFRTASALSLPLSYSIPILGSLLLSLLVFTKVKEKPMCGKSRRKKSCFPVLSSTSIILCCYIISYSFSFS